MKIMKLTHFFSPKNCFFIIVFTVLLIIQSKTSFVYCGNCGGRFTSLEPILKHKQVFRFVGESGKAYNLSSEFFKLKNDYFTNIRLLDTFGNPMINKSVVNNYNHILANIFLENYGLYMRDELADKFRLSDNKISMLEENLKEIFINFFLTKQALTKINLNQTTYVIENFWLSKNLYTGDKFDQYINAIVHLTSSGDFETLVKYANDPKIDTIIIKNKKNFEIFDQLAPDKEFNVFVQKILGDLIQLIDPTIMQIKTKVPLILDGYTFDYRGRIISKTIILPEKMHIIKSEYLLETLDIMFNIKTGNLIEAQIDLKKPQIDLKESQIHLK